MRHKFWPDFDWSDNRLTEEAVPRSRLFSFDARNSFVQFKDQISQIDSIDF